MFFSENLEKLVFKPYNRYGQTLDKLFWYNINYSDYTGIGTYILKFEPDTYTRNHIHLNDESFYVINGTIYDSLHNKTFKKGSYVNLKKNTSHYSYSKSGCTLLVFSQGHIKRSKL